MATSIMVRLDLLAIACDPSVPEIERVEAWRSYEANQWLLAHVERGLPWEYIPVEWWGRVREVLERDKPKVA